MEPVGVVGGEWNYFGTYSNEEADFMAQLLDIQNDIMGVDEASMYSSDNTNMYCFSQGDYSSGEVKNTSSPFEVDDFLNNKDMRGARMEEKFNNPLEKSKKRSCNSGDVQKNKRNVKSRKTPNNNEEDNNAALHRRSSSRHCSEDDSNAYQELNGGGVTSSSSSKGAVALNSNGKTRASIGSATDPQSLYARKRRERINERLRILQNLVPNGTKVDISTMLEEAVQYVKFLQLQIKLLSSDDLWMYAPLAYNGMDVGLYLKIAMPRS